MMLTPAMQGVIFAIAKARETFDKDGPEAGLIKVCTWHFTLNINIKFVWLTQVFTFWVGIWIKQCILLQPSIRRSMRNFPDCMNCPTRRQHLSRTLDSSTCWSTSFRIRHPVVWSRELYWNSLQIVTWVLMIGTDFLRKQILYFQNYTLCLLDWIIVLI